MKWLLYTKYKFSCSSLCAIFWRAGASVSCHPPHLQYKWHCLSQSILEFSVSVNGTDRNGGSAIKDQPAMPRLVGDVGSIPGLERYPGIGNGNPLQYSCLGNPMDRGAWWSAVHGVARVGQDSGTKQQLQDIYWSWRNFAWRSTQAHSSRVGGRNWGGRITRMRSCLWALEFEPRPFLWLV